jgi:hypothetical protein
MHTRHDDGLSLVLMKKGVDDGDVGLGWMFCVGE